MRSILIVLVTVNAFKGFMHCLIQHEQRLFEWLYQTLLVIFTQLP